MYFQELKPYGFREFKIGAKEQKTKEELQDEAQRRCQEIVNELQHRTGEMVDYEGIEDTIIQNVILIMRDLNEMIDINNQDQTMEWSFDWNCINKRYIYVSLTKPIIKIMDRSSGSLANKYYSSILGRKNSRSP